MTRWTCRLLVAVAVFLSAVAGVQAQPKPPKPGPESEILKNQEGTWDATMKMAGSDQESKGTMTCKLECAGLWLTSSFEGNFGGFPFQGRGLDSYDQNKKKYVGVWVDSMITAPMVMEGTYDKDKKQLTMTGASVDTEGMTHKHKMVSTFVDKDNYDWAMYVIDKEGKEKLMMTAKYKRKK